MRYADPVMRCLSKGEKVYYAALLKCVSNQRTLDKLLPEVEKEEKPAAAKKKTEVKVSVRRKRDMKEDEEDEED